MDYTFEMKMLPTKLAVIVKHDTLNCVAGILYFAESVENGKMMVHLPYFRPVSMSHILVIWKHLALHLGKTDYIAYIEHRPDVQRLAEHVGFKRHGEYWQYDNPNATDS